MAPGQSTQKNRQKRLFDKSTRRCFLKMARSRWWRRLIPFYLRPLPPLEPGDDDGKELEVNDVVDAFWLDGWWVGVVVKVLNAKTYSVFFDDPPDLLVLKRSALRPHWDWVGGRWVRSQIRLCPLVCIARRFN